MASTSLLAVFAASGAVDVLPAGAVSKKSKLPFSKADESYSVENNIRFGEVLLLIPYYKKLKGWNKFPT